MPGRAEQVPEAVGNGEIPPKIYKIRYRYWIWYVPKCWSVASTMCQAEPSRSPWHWTMEKYPHIL